MRTLTILLVLMSYSANAETWEANQARYDIPVCQPAPKVKRKHKARPKVKPPECKPEIKTEVRIETVIEKVEVIRPIKRNRFHLLIGVAPGGVHQETFPDQTIIYKDFGLVLGLAYDRQISERWSLGVVGATNGSILIGPGYSW